MLRLLGQNVGEETGWKRFRVMVKQLSTAFALAVPREETKEITPHLAFFQRIASMIRKRLADDAEPTLGGGRIARHRRGGRGGSDRTLRGGETGRGSSGHFVRRTSSPSYRRWRRRCSATRTSRSPLPR